MLMFDPGGTMGKGLFYSVMLIACVAGVASEYVACPISKGFVSRQDGYCCMPIECGPESKLVNLQMCLKGEKINCKCDVNRGYYGQDPLACDRVNSTIMIKMQQPGHELLLTGQVQECKEGYYKSKSDNSSCVPYKICAPGYKVQFSGSKTQNRKCVRDIFTTSKRKIDVLVIKKSTPAMNDTREEDGWPTSTT